MNRDNIIGLILIFVILIGFGILNTPSEEERQQITTSAGQHFYGSTG
jgi:hypothetical protein